MQSKKRESLWLEEYKDCFTFKTKPVTGLFLERFFTDLVKEAAHNEDVLTMADLFMRKGVPSETYYGWVKRYPIASEANEMAKGFIANRREKGALKRKFDVGMAMFSMPMYSDEWKKLVEWKSSLKQKEEKAKGNITVIMEKFAETNHVPLKQKIN